MHLWEKRELQYDFMKRTDNCCIQLMMPSEIEKTMQISLYGFQKMFKQNW